MKRNDAHLWHESINKIRYSSILPALVNETNYIFYAFDKKTF